MAFNIRVRKEGYRDSCIVDLQWGYWKYNCILDKFITDTIPDTMAILGKKEDQLQNPLTP